MYIFAPISTRHLFVAALAFGAAGRIAKAQDPVKLPGVVVKATPHHPGPRRMGGVVRDTFELYAPQVRTIEVDSLGGTGDFELLPTSRALPAVGTSRFCPLVYVWLR